MMQPARLVMRRHAAAVARRAAIQHFATATPAAASTAAATHADHLNDVVRLGIQKLLNESKSNIPSSSTAPATTSRTDATSTTATSASEPTTSDGSASLNRTLQTLQHQLQEARLCIQDCHDCTAAADGSKSQLTEEIRTADRALEQAVASLVDLLDDLRLARLTTEEEAHWAPLREAQVAQLKELRNDLDSLQVQQ